MVFTNLRFRQVPPPYRAGDSPPSYDEVEAKLTTMAGADPTPDMVLEAAASLSDEDIKVLVDGSEDHWPLYSKEKDEEFTLHAGEYITSDEARTKSRARAYAVSQANKDIDDTFYELQLAIAKIDRIHKSNFQLELTALKGTFQSIVTDSRTLAATIGAKVSTFDTLIIPLCASNAVPLDIRKDELRKYLETAAGFEADSRIIQTRYSNLKTDFATFVDSFSDWAKDKEGELTEQIRQIERDLDELNKRLNEIDNALLGVGAVFAAVAPVAEGFTVLFPEVAAFIIIGALIAGGLALGAIVGLLIEKSIIQGKIIDKERQKEILLEQIEQIRQARSELEDLGNVSLIRFSDAIDVLSGSWDKTVEDASAIQEWLDAGADEKKEPAYLKLNTRSGVRKYVTVSDFMETYARAA